MAASTFRAAKTICALSGWEVSNLPLQKLLYLSHMVHMGEEGAKLVSGHFEAWDLGPVEPSLYQKVKAYGSRSIVDIFAEQAYSSGSSEHKSIKKVVDRFGSASPGMLVAITHRTGGAWAQHYKRSVKGIVIPNRDIKLEYRRWFQPQ